MPSSFVLLGPPPPNQRTRPVRAESRIGPRARIVAPRKNEEWPPTHSTHTRHCLSSTRKNHLIRLTPSNRAQKRPARKPAASPHALRPRALDKIILAPIRSSARCASRRPSEYTQATISRAAARQSWYLQGGPRDSLHHARVFAVSNSIWARRALSEPPLAVASRAAIPSSRHRSAQASLTRKHMLAPIRRVQ